MPGKKSLSMFFVCMLLLTGLLGLLVTPPGSIRDPASVRPPTTVFADGDGSRGNPYQISDVNQLQSMHDDLNGNYVLINDILKC